MEVKEEVKWEKEKLRVPCTGNQKKTLKWQLVKDREHLTNPVLILLVTHSDRKKHKMNA